MTLYDFRGDEIVPPGPPEPPRDEFPIRVHLRDSVGGETRVVGSTGWMDEDVFDDYIWSEGNDSCDCNRSRLLWPDDESRWLPCSRERIEIDRIERADTGEVLWRPSRKASGP